LASFQFPSLRPCLATAEHQTNPLILSFLLVFRLSRGPPPLLPSSLPFVSVSFRSRFGLSFLLLALLFSSLFFFLLSSLRHLRPLLEFPVPTREIRALSSAPLGIRSYVHFFDPDGPVDAPRFRTKSHRPSFTRPSFGFLFFLSIPFVDGVIGHWTIAQRTGRWDRGRCFLFVFAGRDANNQSTTCGERNGGCAGCPIIHGEDNRPSVEFLFP
jgi:hypothetical protein